MPRIMGEKPVKKVVLRTIAIFIVSYLVSLLVWIQVKDSYAQGIVLVASKTVAGIKGVKVQELVREGDTIQATFAPLDRQSRMLIDIPVKTSTYTFNMPLTLAIMASLYPLISNKWRAYAEVLLILVTVHLLYVLSLELNQLTIIFIDRGLETAGIGKKMLYEYLWSFIDNMLIRFEPFLLGCYLYLRYKV